MIAAYQRRRPNLPGTPWLRALVAAVGAGLALAALGPFGSYLNGDLVVRALYWVGAMLVGVPLYGGVYMLTGRLTGPGSRWRPMALLLATLLASVPQALLTRLMALALWPMLEVVGPSPAMWFVQTAVIGGLAMVIAARLAAPARSSPSVSKAEMPRETASTGLGDALALQMEDHYVRVHRRDGSELVLMPLGRAIKAVETEGLRTHRSWWVARHAVETIEGDARSMRVRLSNGVVAPVARSAVVRLKAAGWLVVD